MEITVSPNARSSESLDIPDDEVSACNGDKTEIVNLIARYLKEKNEDEPIQWELDNAEADIDDWLSENNVDV